jgi:hypothetical protein
MEINILIIIGILLLLMAVLFALPFFGVGMIIPVIGDGIDIPLSMIMGVAGIVMLIVGGLLMFFVEYWWLFALTLVIVILLNFVKLRIKVIRG